MQHIRNLIGLVSLATFIAGFTASADSISLGLTVTPGKLEASMPPGSSYNLPITVNNTTPTSSHVLTTLNDFGLSESGEYQFSKVGSHPYSLLKWASLRPREFDIPSGTTQQVQLTISVPSESNLSGEYAGLVFFQTRPERHGNGVAFSARVASKIYVTIPGTVKIDGAIMNMSSSKASDGQNYKILFKNTGNAHVYCRGMLSVQKGGSVIYQVPMPDGQLVERGGERTIAVHGRALEPGSYEATATVDYGGKNETGGQIRFEVH